MKSIKSFDYDDAIRSVQTLSKNTPIKISGEQAEIEVVIFQLQIYFSVSFFCPFGEKFPEYRSGY